MKTNKSSTSHLINKPVMKRSIALVKRIMAAAAVDNDFYITQTSWQFAVTTLTASIVTRAGVMTAALTCVCFVVLANRTIKIARMRSMRNP